MHASLVQQEYRMRAVGQAISDQKGLCDLPKPLQIFPPFPLQGIQIPVSLRFDPRMLPHESAPWRPRKKRP